MQSLSELINCMLLYQIRVFGEDGKPRVQSRYDRFGHIGGGIDAG